MDKKNFWYEALKAGTIVGLVNVAFALVVQPFDGETQQTWISLLNIFSWIVVILLLYGFTRRMASLSVAAEPSKGFSFARGVGFIVATMMFTGVIAGLYSSIMSNYFIKDEVLATLDEVMVIYQDMLPDVTFDELYAMARKSVLNPFYVTFSSVLSSSFIGLLISLIVAAITRRQPDIFAEKQNNIDENTLQNE